VSKSSRSGGPGRRGCARVYSLVPLIAFSLLAAILMAQNSVTLAYPSFQSPVEAPSPTLEPLGPPAESPVAPPAETPLVTPGESPVAPPGEEATPSAGPEVTPGAEASPEGPSPSGEPEDESSSRLRGVSSAVLIDAFVVGLSSLWLCCGGVVLVVFLLLVAASFVLRVS
jgi:hypothetical protein